MRKALAVLVPVLALLVAAAPLAAQDGGGDLARITFWSTDDVEGFEAGLAAHNGFHAAHQDPSPLFTWQILTGERSGQYLRGSFDHTWADFDAQEEMAEADAADSAAHLDPYITGAEPAIYRFLPDISRPHDGGPKALARILVFELKFGMDRQFAEAVAKVHAALGEVESWRPYFWYELVDGGHVPTYVLSLPSDDWAGFAPSEPGLGAVVAQKYGDQTSAIFEAFEAAVKAHSTYTVALRPDLSYVPSGGEGEEE